MLRIPARRLAWLAGMLVASTPAVADTTAGVAAPVSASAEPSRPALNPLAERYRAAMAQSDSLWKATPQGRVAFAGPAALAEGASGPVVAAVRERLGLAAGDTFDAALGERIALYRRDHGLPAGRSIDAGLVESLNLGEAWYRDKYASNFARTAALPADLGQRYVLVNIATQTLYMYANGAIVGTMKVVVGKVEDKTPVITTKLDHVVLNPYWNVPPDLTAERYAPRMIAGGKAYMTSRRFEALSGWEPDARVLRYEEVDWQAVAAGKVELRLRQLPGPGNGMGNIKFMFPNAYGVYLHDTSSTDLFLKDPRLFSAGCVRVEKPWVLAEWLFGHRPTAAGLTPEQAVPLPVPVPLYLTYLTVWPEATGFRFANDVYAMDRSALASAAQAGGAGGAR